jgi:hypothetical protein
VSIFAISSVGDILYIRSAKIFDLILNPGGHPKSPTCGHLKIPHPTVVFKA